MFFWTVFETAIWASSAPLWYLFWTIYYLTTFRDLSTNCSEFWGKNFWNNCQTAFNVYRRVFWGKNAICKQSSTFIWLLDFGPNQTDFPRKKNSERFSELTSTCTEGQFEGKRLSNKTKFLLIFFKIWSSIFPVRLSKPHSDSANDHFVVNQVFVKKILFLIISRVRAEIFGASGDVNSALLSKLHFAFPVDLSDTFSEFFSYFEFFRDMRSKC